MDPDREDRDDDDGGHQLGDGAEAEEALNDESAVAESDGGSGGDDASSGGFSRDDDESDGDDDEDDDEDDDDDDDEEEEEDDDDDDSVATHLTHLSCDLVDATNLLEESAMPLILKVSIDSPSAEVLANPALDVDDDIDVAWEHNRQEWFRRFVAAFRTSGTVREVRFVRGTFQAGGGGGGGNDLNDEERAAGDVPSERDLRALFGEVLPNHPELSVISFSQCTIDPDLLRAFFDSLAAARPVALSKLVIRTIPLSMETCAALGNALQRNVPIGTLALVNCRLDSDRCRLVAQGAAHNPHLQLLAMADREGTLTVRADTFRDVISSSAQCDNLISVGVHAHAWDPQGYVSFMDGMHTNRKIQTMLLGRHDGGTFDDPTLLEPIERMLRWHNYTLRVVHLTPEPPQEVMASIQVLLDRNGTICTTAAALEERNYRVNPPALWPLVMQRVGTMPNLVYLLLRRGNVEQFASCVRGLMMEA